jgi:acylphosphatase
MKAFRALLTGYVQGVGFRYYAIRTAESIGNITGYVRNLPDGRVEVVAEGPEEALTEFLNWLHRGPSSAVVERVDVEWLPYTGRFKSFSVKY